MLNKGPIQPLECTVGLTPERVRLGDLDGPIVLEPFDQFHEVGGQLFLAEGPPTV